MRRFLTSLVLLAAAACPALGDDSTAAPARIGPTERTGRALAQLEVMVDGPVDAVGSLTVGDFQLFVSGRPVDLVAVDKLCPSQTEAIPTDEKTSPASDAVPPARASFLFYFDQHNLTIEGRETSIRLAEEMVSELVGNGSRVALVSAGKRLVTVSDFSAEVGELHSALEALRKDRTQWDDYPSLEHNRYRQITQAGWSSPHAACGAARSYQREEITRTEGALELFSSVLGRFQREDPPKIVIYFGDTTRIAAGRHYFALLKGGCNRSSFDAFWAFRRVIQDAAAFGVRVYAVQAAGLTDTNFVSRTAQSWATQDSQSGLKALALDTGGDAFLNGASAGSMVERIEADSDCLYVLNFDPAPFPEDEALAVRIEVDRPAIRTRSRSHVVIQSDSARRTSELLSAFASPETVTEGFSMYGAVVPIGFEKRRFRALVQAVIPKPTLPDGEAWDIGASLVFGSVVRSDVSGRIAVDRAGVPLVLESEMSFRAGPYDVRLVGQEVRSGGIAAGKLSGEWPHLEEQPSITEIVVLQPSPGAFLRNGESRTSGSLAVPRWGAVRAERPSALVCLVCRPGDIKKALIVERSLAGENAVEFPSLELPADQGPCVQVRDLIPAKTLTSGSFRYTVRVKGVGVERTREFHVEGRTAERP